MWDHNMWGHLWGIIIRGAIQCKCEAIIRSDIIYGAIRRGTVIPGAIICGAIKCGDIIREAKICGAIIGGATIYVG